MILTILYEDQMGIDLKNLNPFDKKKN